jgi:hypothetical protein
MSTAESVPVVVAPVKSRSRFRQVLFYSFAFVVIFVAIVCVVVMFQPNHYVVIRSETIHAPASVIFPHVNTAKKWEAWSPFQKIDPTIKNSYSGPTSGVGAVTQFVGNANVGEGSTTIVTSTPNKLIHFKLDMIKPCAGSSDVAFTFAPKGDETVVTWRLSGELMFMPKLINMIIGMDNIIGPTFQDGLQSLKAVAEAEQAATSTSAPDTKSATN